MSCDDRCARCRKHIFNDGLPHDYYMVRQELWDQYSVGRMLCFQCFEVMLGRSLKVEDLLPCPASTAAWMFIEARATDEMEKYYDWCGL